MQCPRGCGLDLREVSLEGFQDATIHLCPNCEGAWYPFGSLLTVGDAGMAVVEQSELAISLEPDKLERIDLQADVKCPVCTEVMKRYAYALGPEVELDECPEHGTWLDDGELGTILERMAENQAKLEQYRTHMKEMREAMDIESIAKGSPYNPFALTMRVLNRVFSGGKNV